MKQHNNKKQSCLEDFEDVSVLAFEKYKHRYSVKALLVLLMLRILTFCFLSIFTVFSVITPLFYPSFHSLKLKYVLIYLLSSIFFILLDSLAYINLKMLNPKDRILAIVSSSACIIALIIFILTKSRIREAGQIILTCLFVYNAVIIALTFLTTQQRRTAKFAEPVWVPNGENTKVISDAHIQNNPEDLESNLESAENSDHMQYSEKDYMKVKTFNSRKHRSLIVPILVLLLLRALIILGFSIVNTIQRIDDVNNFINTEYLLMLYVSLIVFVLLILLDCLSIFNIRKGNIIGINLAMINSAIIFIFSISAVMDYGRSILVYIIFYNIVVLYICDKMKPKKVTERSAQLAEPVFENGENLPYENPEPENQDSGSEITEKSKD